MNTILAHAADPAGFPAQPVNPPAAHGARSSSPAVPEAQGANPPGPIMDISIMMAIYSFALLLAAGLLLRLRAAHESAWHWGAALMNAPLAWVGLAALAVLAVAAVAAWRVRSPGGRRAALLLALACGVGFLSTLAVDVESKWHYGIRPGSDFRPNERYAARAFGVRLPRAAALPASLPASRATPAPVRTVDAAQGRRLFVGTCASCHGLQGEGLTGQGKALIANEFVAGQDDAKLVSFLKVGRNSWEPGNTTGLQMPPRGGNPTLSDDDLRDLAAFLRTISTATRPAADAAATAAGDATEPSSTAMALEDELALLNLMHRWVYPPGQAGPGGLRAGFVVERVVPAWRPPRDARVFVHAYYMVVVLGMLHGLALVGLLLALLIHTWRGVATTAARRSLAGGAVAAVGVAVIWAALMPVVMLN